MTREQVIKALECCLEHEDCNPWTYCANPCPYGVINNGNGKCFAGLMEDAIALLKVQEPKQARKVTYHVKITQGYEKPRVATRYGWLCPTCKSLLCRGVDVIDDNYHFCKVCGQAVKWE